MILMKIEKYIKTGKSKYQLYLDNGEVLDTYDDVILKEDLLLKKEFDSYTYQRIITQTKLQEYYNACLKYISIRIRSTKEIIDYLKRKKVAEEDIDYIVQKLTKEKLLDDNYFCQCFIKDKLRFTTMGDYKIIYELKKHNITQNIIENNRYLIDEEVLTEKIDKIIRKKIETNKKLDKSTLRNKLYNNLLNSGYSSSLVTKRLNYYF